MSRPKGHPDGPLLASIASHESWAKTPDRSARTAPGRAAADARFLDQAEGDPIRAEHLRKAYYLRLALRSAQTRRKAREQRGARRKAREQRAAAKAAKAAEAGSPKTSSGAA